MLLKASSVKNLTDARYFAAKEVNYLGFNIEEGSPDYIDPVYMKAIREWVAGPHIVGEFTKAPTSHVVAAAEFYNLDVVQLTAEHHLANLPELRDLEIILKISGNLEPSYIDKVFRSAAPHVSCFLLVFSGTSDWESMLYKDTDFWNELFELRPTLLQADLSTEQLSPLFNKLNLAGLSFVGGEEEMVGVKSFDEIDEIFEAIEE